MNMLNKKSQILEIISLFVLLGYFLVLSFGLSTNVHFPSTFGVNVCEYHVHPHGVCVNDNEKHAQSWIDFLGSVINQNLKNIGLYLEVAHPVSIPIITMVLFPVVVSLYRKRRDMYYPHFLQELFSSGILHPKLY